MHFLKPITLISVLGILTLNSCYKPPSLKDVSTFDDIKDTEGWERYTFANFDSYENSTPNFSFEPKSIRSVTTLSNGSVLIIDEDYSDGTSLYTMQKGNPEPQLKKNIADGYGVPEISPNDKLVYSYIYENPDTYSYYYDYRGIATEDLNGDSDFFTPYYYEKYYYSDDTVKRYFENRSYTAICDNTGKYWLWHYYGFFEQVAEPDEENEVLFEETTSGIGTISEHFVFGENLYLTDNYNQIIKIRDGKISVLPKTDRSIEKMQEAAGELYQKGTDGNLYKLSGNQWTHIPTPTVEDSYSNQIVDFYVDSNGDIWFFQNKHLFVQKDGEWHDKTKYIETNLYSTGDSYIFEFDGYIYTMFSNRLYRTNIK